MPSMPSSPNDAPVAAGLQLPGVLDELFFYDGPLGARVSDEGTSIDVWAPTAQQVWHRAAATRSLDPDATIGS